MTRPKTPQDLELGSAMNWLVELLSDRWAEHIGERPKGLIEALKDGLGKLPPESWETWVVEWPDGTRSHQKIITRTVFFNSTERVWPPEVLDLIVPVGWDEQVWPPEVFNDDKLDRQATELCERWKSQTGKSVMNFHSSLRHALRSAERPELGVLCWKTKTRSIRREDFVAWFEASTFSRMSSMLSTSLSVTADDLWPRHERSGTAQSAVWAIRRPRARQAQAVIEAAKVVFKNGVVPHGMGSEECYHKICTYLRQQGRTPPSFSTFKRAKRGLG